MNARRRAFAPRKSGIVKEFSNRNVAWFTSNGKRTGHDPLVTFNLLATTRILLGGLGRLLEQGCSQFCQQGIDRGGCLRAHRRVGEVRQAVFSLLGDAAQLRPAETCRGTGLLRSRLGPPRYHMRQAGRAGTATSESGRSPALCRVETGNFADESKKVAVHGNGMTGMMPEPEKSSRARCQRAFAFAQSTCIGDAAQRPSFQIGRLSRTFDPCLAQMPMKRLALAKDLVGERGFEPPAPASRRQCSTRLSYSPTDDRLGAASRRGGL